MRHARTLVLTAALLSICAGSMTVMAQAPGGGPGGDGGPRGNFDPEQMRQRVMAAMQEQMDASDDEWKIIQPMIQKVWELQRETRSAGGGGFFGGMRGMRPNGMTPPDRQGGEDRQGRANRQNRADRGDRSDRQNRGGRFGFNPEPMPELEALQAALDSPDTSASDIKEKLTAYRNAKKKKVEDLKKAQDELRQILTVRQEATLVMMGTLE